MPFWLSWRGMSVKTDPWTTESDMRKYSISEINQMRENLRFICRDNSVAEDQLRTYMLNGTEPEELAYACFEEIQRRVQFKRRTVNFSAQGSGWAA